MQRSNKQEKTEDRGGSTLDRGPRYRYYASSSSAMDVAHGVDLADIEDPILSLEEQLIVNQPSFGSLLPPWRIFG